MSDRLEELRRQRALQREHLDWMDREIAALEAANPPPRPATLPPRLDASPRDRDAEAILQEYVQPDQSIRTQTKMGCFLYFGLALALLALLVLATYFYSKARHGH